MLGIGDAVPMEPVVNVMWRREMWTKALADGEKYQKKLIERCTADIHFYINGWVWQYNPNNRLEPIGPFIEWGFQEEAVGAILGSIEAGRDLVIEKSREMGASWLCLIVMEWLWHFRLWQKFLMVSRSADAVDEPGDPDCLFWKIDFVHDHQPDWLILPYLGYKKRRKMGYKNYVNGSTITGEASTGKVGVGGRATAMFVDEFAQIKEDYAVLHRTSDTTKCRIFNSTHLGLETAFYELTQRVDMKKLRMHWTQHPEKVHGLYQSDGGKVEVLDKQFAFADDFKFVMDGKVRSPWYDDQCRRKGSNRAVAMDLDINPEGSVAQFVDQIAEFTSLINTYCRAPDWIGGVLYDRETGRPRGVEKTSQGPLLLWGHLKPDGTPPFGVYKIGVDTSSGTGRTNSCLSIVDGRTGEKFGELATPHMLPDQFALLAVAICWLFKTEEGEGAQIVWEKQGPGVVFGRRLMETGYRNVYDAAEDKGPTSYRTGRSNQWAPGFVATAESKRVLLEEYRAALLARQFLNRSEKALREFFRFKYTPSGTVEHMEEASRNDPSGARANHGDRVIADALAWRLAKQTWAVRKREIEKEVPVMSLEWRRQLHKKQEDEDY